MDESDAVREVLDERPELESPLRDVLDVDDANETWTFDDLPVDSGAFGELVSRGLVEQAGDEYRVADPTAVRAALDGQETVPETDKSRVRANADRLSGGREAIRERFAAADTRAAGMVAAVLAAVVLARAYVYPVVFRDGAVVLSGNDPYYYRYWVEQALAESGGRFDFSSLATMSNTVQTGEPLLVTVLWLFSSLFGGDATVAGWVLAWYPVVAAVVTAGVLYLLTVRVTADRRIALAAVLLLAVTPAHAMRTSLGFADHHAFDYVWLILTAYALVRLDRTQVIPGRFGGDSDDRAADRKRENGPAWREAGQWATAGGLGLAVTGQVLAWDASPLLLAPLGLYVAVRVLDDVRAGRSPVDTQAPLAGGVALGALLVHLVHTRVGWHSDTVAYAPALLLVGVVGVLGVGELAHRLDRSALELGGVEVIGGAIGVVGFSALFPAYWAEALDGLGRLTRRDSIAEVQSLLSGDAFGWLLLFGFVLVLAVPYLAWASRRAYFGDRKWLVPVVYCWYFLGLAVFQVRFAGQLAMFAAVFAGLGFVHLAAVVDITRSPVPFAGASDSTLSMAVPDRRSAGYLVVLFLFVGSLSLVQVPVKTGQITTDGDAYRSAAWMSEYANEQGWEYPDTYVFSRWGENRLYNYFVNGESSSYSFAQQNFNRFALSEDGVRWYHRLNDKVRFIVIANDNRAPGANTLHARLSEPLGDLHESGSLSHYRALYQSRSGERRVYTLVPGARVTGPTKASTAEIETDVTLTHGQFTYVQQIENDHGIFVFTTPYPGTYTIGDQQVTVTEADVYEGNDRVLFDGPGAGSWRFNEGSGTVVYDRWGGNHLQLNGTEWTDDGTDFRGKDAFGTADAGDALSVGADESLTVRVTIQGNLSRTTESYPTVLTARGDGEVGIWARNVRPDFGVRVTDDEGDDVRLFAIDQLHFESPTTVTVVLDRDADELRLYRNYSLVGSRDTSELDAVTVSDPLAVGARTPGNHPAPVVVSDLQVYRNANPPDETNTTG
jgi:dolichyl-diphosphooligosaccharide--protein glycosyltransferase